MLHVGKERSSTHLNFSTYPKRASPRRWPTKWLLLWRKKKKEEKKDCWHLLLEASFSLFL